MNRRSMLKAAAAGVAACCGLKVAEPAFRRLVCAIGPTQELLDDCVLSSNSVDLSVYGDVCTVTVFNSAGEPMTVEVEDIKRWYRIPDGMI